MKSERILGIDPGFGRIGYGVIEQKKNTWHAVSYGCITTNPKETFVERLKDLHEELADLIKEYKPTRLAVEELFFFKNLKTAMPVSQAKGVMN